MRVQQEEPGNGSATIIPFQREVNLYFFFLHSEYLYTHTHRLRTEIETFAAFGFTVRFARRVILCFGKSRALYTPTPGFKIITK